MNSDRYEKQGRRFRSISLSDFEWSPASRYDQNDTSRDVNYDCRANGEKSQGGSESVSSTDDIPVNVGEQESHKVTPDCRTETQAQAQAQTQSFCIEKTRRKIYLMPVCGLPFVLLALLILFTWMNDQNEFDGHYLVPT